VTHGLRCDASLVFCQVGVEGNVRERSQNLEQDNGHSIYKETLDTWLDLAYHHGNIEPHCLATSNPLSLTHWLDNKHIATTINACHNNKHLAQQYTH